MKRLLVIPVLAAACTSTPPIPAPFQMRFDTTNAETVVATLRGTRKLPPDFAVQPGTRLLVQKAQSRDKSLTPAGFADAVSACAAGQCQDTDAIRLAATRAKLEDIDAFVRTLAQPGNSWATESAATVTRHLPPFTPRRPFPVHFVLGGRSDAYVEVLDGTPAMAIDVRTILQGTPKDTQLQLRAMLDHEAWHVGFLDYVAQHWAVRNPEENRNPDYQLVFTMLNEGYGHYLSIVAYTGDEVQARELLRKRGAEDGGFLTTLSKKLDDFARASPEEKLRLIEESHIADRIWTKWSAMAGALAIADLRASLGEEATLALLKHDTTSLLAAHAKNPAASFRWPESFIRLLERLR